MPFDKQKLGLVKPSNRVFIKKTPFLDATVILSKVRSAKYSPKRVGFLDMISKGITKDDCVRKLRIFCEMSINNIFKQSILIRRSGIWGTKRKRSPSRWR